jgi:hypothetical protein
MKIYHLKGSHGLFHRHKWTEVRRFTVPPSDPTPHHVGIMPLVNEPLGQAAQGYICIEYKCDKCSKTKTKYIYGAH